MIDLYQGRDPKDKDIATVLSDMDAKISALEARRAKTQAIKQGVMQEPSPAERGWYEPITLNQHIFGLPSQVSH